MKRILIWLCLCLCFAGGLEAKDKIAPKYKTEFFDRYRFFITKEDQKAFEKLTTDEARDKFIVDFWAERDSDPRTPENEFKNTVDQRISDIENEALMTQPEMLGITFRNNGGLNGGMAQVYLLHGRPTFMEKASGVHFVDLVLWVYADAAGNHKYRFVFYRRSNSGSLLIYRPPIFRDMTEAIREISNNPGSADSLQDAYDELNQQNRLILIALVVFSDYSDVNVDDALKPPKSLQAEFKKEEAVVDLTTKPPENLVPGRYHSMIAGEANVSSNLETKITFRSTDADWLKVENHFETELVTFFHLTDMGNGQVVLAKFAANFKRETALSEKQLNMFLINDNDIKALPAGTYRLVIYMRSNIKDAKGQLISYKYMAVVATIQKQPLTP